ncbi:hypothetical protein LRY65_03530 [Candidatus Woesebacteria bacterium]|nr:hypothetical protein [Candidatus Woesebacteria bacterium]MCD8506965.1 hypothetical protein [Candidatus Woesebacteria bacterium]MCD8527256.1 hypothetical protein [Candidatus Woesebacteria bacterium]MCD8546623.1 hypothetical protein [Candidatus Woesebacteria bacterium]
MPTFFSPRVLNQIKFSVVFGLFFSVALTTGIHLLLQEFRTVAQDPVVLETTLTASRYLNSAVIGGTATVLALLLNLLSIGYTTEKKLDREFYLQMQGIALLSSVALVLAVCALLFTSFPIVESQELPRNYFPRIYWSFVGLETVIVGFLIAQISVLLQAMARIIRTVRPEYDENPQ